ncbi:MAG TPA: phytanoyl-CoA dioxygenase family protein, partial [Abditibacteriaceae bacterium]|nr:phytanoyl-CoA dioxygenase family protein [Abditibacteriaceae bacterium]
MFERILTDEQIEQFHNDGFLVVRGLFSQEETTLLRDHFMAVHAAGPVEGYFHPLPLEETGGDILKHYPRIMQPHRWDELSRQMLLDARVGSILRDLFDEMPLAAQSMLYFKPPGARGQALHQDNFYLHVKPGTCLASWLALDDADAENG